MSDILLRIASAIVIAASAAVPSASAAFSGEKITDFKSSVQIQPDASLIVEEEISVNATGNSIRHGIYRDIPTRYKDRLGNRYVVGLDILSVKRDGYPEPYAVSDQGDGKRIKIGSPNAAVSYGNHVYSIAYKATRELGFFKNYDELYWNVTGNKWEFPIDRASIAIRLPESVPENGIKTAAWTGPFGGKGTDYKSAVSGNEVRFESSKPLNVGEGLTVAVSWPKGFVTPPAAKDNIGYFFRDNPKWIASLIALSAILAYYFAVWFLVGRDPEQRAIVAEYEPPDGLSPAEMRYLTVMKADDVAFAAAVINMGVKGYLKISDTPDTYSISKTKNDESLLSAEEAALAGKLFGKSKKEISFEPENYDAIRSGKAALEKQLKKRFGSTYFILNSPYAAAGIMISAAAAITTFPGLSVGDFMSLAISAFVTVMAVAIWKTILQIRSLKNAGVKFISGLFVFILVSSVLPTVIGILSSMGGSLSLYSLYAPAVIGVNALFLHLLKRRTPAGQKIQDKITGFKRYLSLAEKDRMNFHNPPEMTPAIFERFLPYALALGVEHKWAEIFSKTVGSVGPEPENKFPSWYHSGKSFSGYSGLALGLSAMGGGIASAVYTSSLIRPGSDSAFGGSSGGFGGFGGGGGFSGGGGGGGGGGGW